MAYFFVISGVFMSYRRLYEIPASDRMVFRCASFRLAQNTAEPYSKCQFTTPMSQKSLATKHKYTNLKTDQIHLLEMHSAADLHCESNAVDQSVPTPISYIKSNNKQKRSAAEAVAVLPAIPPKLSRSSRHFSPKLQNGWT